MKMETIYAAMLLHKAGKKITEGDLEKVLKAAGSKVDKSQIKATVSALKDVDIDEAIKKAPVSAAPQASTASSKKSSEKSEGKKKEESEGKEEKSEEEKEKEEEKAAEGLGALFG